MSIFSKKNILILVGIVLFLTFFTVAVPKEKSIGFESKSIESVVVINGNETEILEEGAAEFFNSVFNFFGTVWNAIKYALGMGPKLDCNTCNCTTNQTCAEKCDKCGNNDDSITKFVKDKLKGTGLTYRPSEDCEQVGIPDEKDNVGAKAACFAYSQVGYEKPENAKTATPKEYNAYASSDGWCCDFVKWAYRMAGNENISCYGGAVTKSKLADKYKVTGLLASNTTENHVAILYKSTDDDLWYRIDGNMSDEVTTKKFDNGTLVDSFNFRGKKNKTDNMEYHLPYEPK